MSLPSTQRYRALLHTYFWPQRRQVTLLFLLIIADNVLLLVGPGLLSQFVDAAIVGAAAPVLVSISAWYLIAALSQQAMTMSATMTRTTTRVICYGDQLVGFWNDDQNRVMGNLVLNARPMTETMASITRRER